MTGGRLVRMPEVVARIGLCERTINRMHRAGKFPPKVQISANSIGWREADIDRWIAEREQVAQQA